MYRESEVDFVLARWALPGYESRKSVRVEMRVSLCTFPNAFGIDNSWTLQGLASLE